MKQQITVVVLLLCLTPHAQAATNAPDASASGQMSSPATNAAPDSAPVVDKKAIDALVVELGRPEFKDRKEALARAATLPADALAALTERLRQSDDPELRSAAGLLSGWAPARLAGEFTGTVENLGLPCPVKTIITWDGKTLQGRYEVAEPGGQADGTLSQFGSAGNTSITCRWQDKYGTGDLKLSFSPDFTSFTGFYSMDGQVGSAQWNGKR